MANVKAVKQSKSSHESGGHQDKSSVHHSTSTADTHSKSNMEGKDAKRRKRRSVHRNLEKREYDLRPRKADIDYCDVKRRARSKPTVKPQKGRGKQNPNANSK